jgi:hypothetical protein
MSCPNTTKSSTIHTNTNEDKSPPPYNHVTIEHSDDIKHPVKHDITDKDTVAALELIQLTYDEIKADSKNRINRRF